MKRHGPESYGPGSPVFEERRKNWQNAGSMQEFAEHPGLAGEESEAETGSPEAEAALDEGSLATADLPSDLSQAGEPSETPDESTVAAELSRWQRKALNRLREGKPAHCFFRSDVLPEALSTWVAETLPHAATPEDVRLVFRGAARRFGTDGHRSRKEFGYQWQVRAQDGERHPLVSETPDASERDTP